MRGFLDPPFECKKSVNGLYQFQFDKWEKQHVFVRKIADCCWKVDGGNIFRANVVRFSQILKTVSVLNRIEKQ